jgi:hypothetical protein
VTDRPLDASEAEAAVADPSCGAVLTFTGQVRDNARGQTVTELAYEAYAEAAERMMTGIAEEITERGASNGSRSCIGSGCSDPRGERRDLRRLAAPAGGVRRLPACHRAV